MLDLDRAQRRATGTGARVEEVVQQLQCAENEWFRLAGGHEGPIGSAIDAARLTLVEAGIVLADAPALIAEVRAARPLRNALYAMIQQAGGIYADNGLPDDDPNYEHWVKDFEWTAVAHKALAAYDKVVG